MPVEPGSFAEACQSVAAAWRAQRAERQARVQLDPDDFDALREAGFLACVVPEADGGAWRDTATSARPVCDTLRQLGAVDSSVALVAAMHPSVVSFWLLNPDPGQPAWEAQRLAVFASAAAGEQWGTITSEPGSGGDITRTRSTAAMTDAEPFITGPSYVIRGDKHFGSGSGIAARMVTTARPAGEDEAHMFVLDTAGWRPPGTPQMSVTALWDGAGMAATQSHAVRLDGARAVRFAYAGPVTELLAGAGAFVVTTFTSVVLGILDEAIATARQHLAPRAAELRAYEQTEWARAVTGHWLAAQAYEGALGAIERGDPTARFVALLAKEAVAELAETVLGQLSRVIGGSAFSRRSPFAHWYEDVRALGFLRPPWGLAYEQLFASSFAT